MGAAERTEALARRAEMRRIGVSYEYTDERLGVWADLTGALRRISNWVIPTGGAR